VHLFKRAELLPLFFGIDLKGHEVCADILRGALQANSLQSTAEKRRLDK